MEGGRGRESERVGGRKGGVITWRMRGRLHNMRHTEFFLKVVQIHERVLWVLLLASDERGRSAPRQLLFFVAF